MKLDLINISDKKKDLENFDGYLPQILLSYINIGEYYKTIEKSKSRDIIIKKLMDAQQFNFKENLRDFRKWLNENPDFIGILKR